MHQETALDVYKRLFRDSFWRDQPTITVSEWAAANRKMPSDTPFPGPWRNEFTPHIVDIQDDMSAFSGVEDVTFVKGTQQAATASAENVAGYWMDAFPTKILFISATQELLTTWVSTRFEKMLDSCGLREKIYSQSEARGHKKTGDRTFLKEFLGGLIRFVSAQSASSLRSVDARIVILDEVDGYPREMSTGEGSPLSLAEARTDAWGERKKIFRFSTPTTFENSLIWSKYELADQRRRFVPCPRCGAFQLLEFGHGFGHENPNLGLQWQIVDGRVVRVWYVCEHCGAELQNHDKRQFLHLGEWRPTSTSYSPKAKSYQLSSLYSPAEMLSWGSVVESYLEAQEKGPDGMRSFVNTRLGLPFRHTGARPKLPEISDLHGDYHAGTVPTGVIFLTCALDVQRGSKEFAGKDVPLEILTLDEFAEKYSSGPKPPRVETEVCGHGIGYRTWSIERLVFTGAIDDPNQGAWASVVDYWRQTLKTYSRHDGKKFTIRLTLVDSGDGPHTPSVYAFAAAWNGVLPSKGMPTIKRRKNEAIEEDVNRSIRRFRVARLDSGEILVEPNGPFYKTQIYNNLKIPRKWDGTPQQANFCDFPVEYGKNYFEQLTSEDPVPLPDGTITYIRSSARPNESLDLRVLNLCARDHYIDQTVLSLQGAAVKRGATPFQVKQINSRTALEFLAASVK